MRSKSRPQRTCVVCREKREKRRLTRLVMVSDRLQVDPSGKLNGPWRLSVRKASLLERGRARDIEPSAAM